MSYRFISVVIIIICNPFLIIIVNSVFKIFIDPVGIWNVFRTESICERDQNNISQLMVTDNPTVSLINKFDITMEFSITRSLFIVWSISSTGGYLLSREKAVKDVNSRVEFCFLVGVIPNFDWPIFSWPIQIDLPRLKSKTDHMIWRLSQPFPD